jgi:hypothetical protein
MLLFMTPSWSLSVQSADCCTEHFQQTRSFNFCVLQLISSGPEKGKKKSGVPLNVEQELLLIEHTGSAVIMAAICTEHGVERQTVYCV